MKTLLLSAFALISITAASFGAENVENLQWSQTKNLTTIRVNFSGTPCADQYVQDMDGLLDAGYGFETANAIATLDFNDCLDAKYGPIEPVDNSLIED